MIMEQSVTTSPITTNIVDHSGPLRSISIHLVRRILKGRNNGFHNVDIVLTTMQMLSIFELVHNNAAKAWHSPIYKACLSDRLFSAVVRQALNKPPLSSELRQLLVSSSAAPVGSVAVVSHSTWRVLGLQASLLLSQRRQSFKLNF